MLKIKKQNLCSQLCLSLLAIMLITSILPSHAHAQTASNKAIVDIMPTAQTPDNAPLFRASNDTHPALKLTPDKSELVRLNKEAGSVIIGNPEHLSILADSAKTLVLIPQVPGATYMTILDKQGSIIMQRHVIIASPKQKYVRIRNACNGNKKDCQSTQMYYCPDMCHKVNVAQEASASENSNADVQVDNINVTPPNVPGDTDTE